MRTHPNQFYLFICVGCGVLNCAESKIYLVNVTGICAECNTKFSDGKQTHMKVFEKVEIDEYCFFDHKLYDPLLPLKNFEQTSFLLSTPKKEINKIIEKHLRDQKFPKIKKK